MNGGGEGWSSWIRKVYLTEWFSSSINSNRTYIFILWHFIIILDDDNSNNAFYKYNSPCLQIFIPIFYVIEAMSMNILNLMEEWIVVNLTNIRDPNYIFSDHLFCKFAIHEMKNPSIFHFKIEFCMRVHWYFPIWHCPVFFVDFI